MKSAKGRRRPRCGRYRRRSRHQSRSRAGTVEDCGREGFEIGIGSQELTKTMKSAKGRRRPH